MNLYIFFLLSIIILISPSNSGLTEEQRKSLLKKVTKLVSFTNKYNPVNQIFRRYGKREMSYNASKVKEIITNYIFPEVEVVGPLLQRKL